MILPYKKILAIDLETTDTNRYDGSIIQIAGVILNENFEIDNTYGEMNMYVKPLNDYRNPKAMAVNKISEETLLDAMSLNDVLELFESYAGQDCILAAWGTYFDIPFLKTQYDKLNRKWPFGHKSLDLKAIAIWEAGKRDIKIKGGISKFLNTIGLEFKGIPHDALSDIKNAINILEYYKRS